jgi:hypothetical protein
LEDQTAGDLNIQQATTIHDGQLIKEAGDFVRCLAFFTTLILHVQLPLISTERAKCWVLACRCSTRHDNRKRGT